MKFRIVYENIWTNNDFEEATVNFKTNDLHKATKLAKKMMKKEYTGKTNIIEVSKVL